MPIIRSLTRGKSIRLLQKQSTKRTNPCVYLEAKAVEQTPATEFNSILQEIISTEYNYSVDLKKTLNEIIMPIEGQSMEREAIGICTCFKTLNQLHTKLYQQMISSGSPVYSLSQSLPAFRDVYHMYTINLSGISAIEKIISDPSSCNSQLLIPLQHLLRYPIHLARVCKMLRKYPFLNGDLRMAVKTLDDFRELCSYIDQEKAREESYQVLSALCGNQGVAVDIPRHIKFKGSVIPATSFIYDFNACVFCDDGLVVWTRYVKKIEMKAVSIEQCLRVDELSNSILVCTLNMKGKLLNRHLAPQTMAASVFLKWYHERAGISNGKENKLNRLKVVNAKT
ncbi:Rho guanine nucleotide exchange factor [Schizosaccharomyces pombe]